MSKLRRRLMQKICDWHFRRWAHYEAKLNKKFCSDLVKSFEDLRSKNNEYPD